MCLLAIFCCPVVRFFIFKLHNNKIRMSKEIFIPRLAETRKNDLRRVVVETEKQFGIFLPTWEDVTHAVNTFASGNFQKKPSRTKEEINGEIRRRNNSEPISDEFVDYSYSELIHYSGLMKKYPAPNFVIDDNLRNAKLFLENEIPDPEFNFSGAWRIDESFYRSKVEGQQFFEMALNIEGLRNEEEETKKRRKEPYLLSVYSKFFNIDAEKELAEAIGKERALLPRRLAIEFGAKDGEASINYDDIATRLNETLGANDNGKVISGLSMMSGMNLSAEKVYPLGTYQGLEMKLLTGNTLFDPKMEPGANVLVYKKQEIFPPHHQPVSLEIRIFDPTLESNMYGTSNMIPPEKRQTARDLVEKVKEAFIR